ncbi:hypothetical protein D9611_002886 [Ephemerocybe angulata]|uniref:JmjC domain-containing protein n=1 Tax=Ephemerocybe angulata TaxID=980116 RepID=A0A8H5FHH6_9AGAR|nr:hypothetical protein D9611_002886 [Tulosesus angulatus]
MNSLHDPSKKTSINSLLNPDVASPFPLSSSSGASHSALNHRQLQPHIQPAVSYPKSTAPYTPNPHFGLRTANWATPSTNGDNYNGNGFSSERRSSVTYPSDKQHTQGSPSRPAYPQHHSEPADGYTSTNSHRFGSQRATSIQTMTGIEPARSWQTSTEPSASTPFGPTSLPESHRRNSMSSNGLQHGAYQNPGTAPPHAEERQNGHNAHGDRGPVPRPGHVRSGSDSRNGLPGSLSPQRHRAIHPESPELIQPHVKPPSPNNQTTVYQSPMGCSDPRHAGYQNTGMGQPHPHSDARPALVGIPASSNGLQPQTGYQNTGTGQPHAAEWQSSERVSVRLAARGTLPSPAPQPQPHAAPAYHLRIGAPPGGPYPIIVAYPAIVHNQIPQHLQQQAPPTTQPSTSSKRQLPESEASTPKAKRPAKAKSKVGPDGGPFPSKRGFNAKKRSEAAQIAAQSAQMTAGEGRDKAAEATNGNDAEFGHAVKELQFARCMSNRYKVDDFPRCVSCTRRWAGDTCRFQGIRTFVKDVNRQIIGMGFNSAKQSEVPVLHFPKVWNVPLQQEHIDRSKKVIAKALLSTLRSEREHLGLQDLIRRARESDVRVTCDTCMTSIFSSSWMCRLCGREACADCFAQVCELTQDAPDATPMEIIERQKRREKYAHSNPFFLACTKRNEHPAGSFSPMSRFFPEELDGAIAEMEKLIAGDEEEGEGGGRRVGVPNALGNAGVLGYEGSPPVDAEGRVDWSELFKTKAIDLGLFPLELMPSGMAGESYIPPNLSEDAVATPYYKVCRYSDSEVTAVESSEKFAKIWAYGEPLVVANILSKFQINWSPDYFIETFGDKECLITECEQDLNKKLTVKDFFGEFGKYEGRTDVWKLKDWPPSADFKSSFPKLYKDFCEAVPVPDYVRRDGVYNIGSHFPSNVVAPDLGPKMYNAWAANQKPGSKGSTRLHMDMADAMNVMLYAAPCPDGSPGCAIWDVYRAEDSDKVRAFLRKRNNLRQHYDPIHGQQYYLDDELRAQMYKEHGVCGYRIYQRPGEAIFIPAGCAHQVSNAADSIKIATDFVSPENIDRCTKLTQEFREQNKSKVWKEDVLQLRTMMWFAWQSCCQREKVMSGEMEEEDVPTPGLSGVGAAGGSGGSPASTSRRRADTTSSQQSLAPATPKPRLSAGKST